MEASERADVPVLVGHQRRHSPDIRSAKRTVEDGSLGPLVAVNGMTLFDKPDAYFVEWRRKAGGGVLLINLIHDIDVLRWLVGEIESIRGFTSSAVRGFEVEDTASLAIRFHERRAGNLRDLGRVGQPVGLGVHVGAGALSSLATGGVPLPCGPKSLPFGVRPVPLAACPRERALAGSARPGASSRRSLPHLLNQLDHFLNVVRRAAPPLISARDGMLTLAATLAVARAGPEDRTVTVAEMLAEAGASS